MITLHAYIMRELLRSFVLAILALSALFTLGGGLYNIMKFEGLTPGDLFTVLPMLLPIVITLTMPVAGLFAATMTYGRLASDNELVACRAAGINVTRVFLSALLLAGFVALFTTVSVNVVIPSFMKRIVYFARGNLRDIAFHRLLTDGHIYHGKAGEDQYLLTAQQVQTIREDELAAKGFERPDGEMSYFWVTRPTFLVLDGAGRMQQFFVAEGGLCQFDTRNDEVNITVYVTDARKYEVGKDVVHIGIQKIGPYKPPIPFPEKPSMVDLATLFTWKEAPWRSRDLLSDINGYLDKLRSYVFYLHAEDKISRGRTLVLRDLENTRHEIKATACTTGRRELILSDVEIKRFDRRDSRPTRYVAPKAKLIARPIETGHSLIEISLEPDGDQLILEYNPLTADYSKPREKDALRLEGLEMPQDVLDEMEQYTPAEVLNANANMPGNELLDGERFGLQEESLELQRKVGSLIHFRLGFASSALVTIIMGAVLGVMFRGSRALAAFGLACVPFGTVTILMLMGRQLAENPGTETIGAWVIWGGLILIGLTDLIVLRFGVRR